MLNAGQKYCRMQNAAILLTFIKLPFAIKIFVLSIFEWPFIQVLLYLSNRQMNHLKYLALFLGKTIRSVIISIGTC